MSPQSAAAQLELLGLRAQDAAAQRRALAAKQEEHVAMGSIPESHLVNEVSHSSREIREVWAWNLDEEFDALLAAVAGESGVMLALDMEFPGFVCAESRVGGINVRYQALRENVDRLRPIQLGAAVASADGILRGVWSFNLRFDVDVDLHTEQSVAFLRSAGINFPRHAAEGIDAAALGSRLSESYLVGTHLRSPTWITFSGAYDLGYLLKLLTGNKPLPEDLSSFDKVIDTYCPRRHELKEVLPHGSLESISVKHGVKRYGQAHTAGSDALLTLELFLFLARRGAAAQKWNQWQSESWGDDNAASPYESWYPWGADWASPVRWEDQYSPFLLSTQGMGSHWMHPALNPLAGSGPAAYMGNGVQNLALKAPQPAAWPDASTAAALLKSSGWHSADPPAVTTQVLAI